MLVDHRHSLLRITMKIIIILSVPENNNTAKLIPETKMKNYLHCTIKYHANSNSTYRVSIATSIT